MINGDLSARLAGARGRLIIELSYLVTGWGGRVPEDPGVAELADLLDGAAANLHDTTFSCTRAELAVAVGRLRARTASAGSFRPWPCGTCARRSSEQPPSRIAENHHRSRCTGVADLLSRPQRLQPLLGFAGLFPRHGSSLVRTPRFTQDFTLGRADLLGHTPAAHRARQPAQRREEVTSRFRKGPRHLLRNAAFAMLRGAAYTVGSAAMSGSIWWLQSR